MGDMHQIVYFRAAANNRRTGFGAVDCGIGSDLHVIADLHYPRMRQSCIAIIVSAETKTFRAYHRSRANHYSRADAASAMNDYSGIKPRPRSQPAVFSYIHIWKQHAPIGDNCASSDITVRADCDIFAQHSPRLYHTPSRNSHSGQSLIVLKMIQYSGECGIRVRYFDHTFVRRVAIHIISNHDAAGSRRHRSFQITIIRRQNHIFAIGVIDTADSANNLVQISV